MIKNQPRHNVAHKQKFPLPDALANADVVMRFQREARAAVKIQSEHVARVIDVGALENGAPYMVMEYLEGIDLAQRIAEQRALPVDEAVRLEHTTTLPPSWETLSDDKPPLSERHATASSVCRTFRTSASGVIGFWMNAIVESRMPCRTTCIVRVARHVEHLHLRA